MNVFRITRAEFAKVFKKPTVYIMAFILAVVLVISLLTYNPILSQKSSISIEGDNAAAVYTTFMGNSITEETKNKLDNEYYKVVNGQIDFYNKLYDRANKLTDSLNSFKNNYVNLSNVYYEDNHSPKLDELMTFTKTKITNLLDNYANITAFEKYEGLKNIANATKLDGTRYLDNTYFDDNNTYSYKTLKENYIPKLLETTNATTFITIVTTNNYQAVFENLTNYGNNIIYNILNDIIHDITTIQNDFYQLVIGDLSIANKQLMIQKAENLNEKVDEYKLLYEGLIKNEFAYAITTKSNYEILTSSYDLFKSIYGTIEIDNENEFKSKKAGAQALKGSSYISNFQNCLDSLTFIEVSENFVKTLNNYTEITNTNSQAILANIENHKSVTSTTEILKDINNYKLLGETYKKIVDCEIANHLSTRLSLHQMADVKNYDLTNYNDYKNKQTISSLKYQLDNNTYSNSFGNVISLNETLAPQKNMYDFTYYALKISTFLITIFTIMMIANLITSETDSGTIKLLLIRPYRRGTVLCGKILATFFFSLSFVILAIAISLVGGYFMFGLPSSETLLVTFNATTTFLISPEKLLLLFFASCVGDILFYLIVALTISVLFKSYIGAISTSLITYVGAMVVGSLLSTTSVYAYLPFTNISWFRFFGGEIVPIRSGIGALLANPVHSLQTFSMSVMITVIFSLVLLLITFISFKRRDF